ncbi:hypothetical protein HELRODRAFT_184269 [Helobdella robusta]|uniref:SAP domain-containing protein n=1 Tax=Helobdella robusta TaxID=6412 RepID=T1FIH8_HELRO|nr:hypothetical protein HELRODRAFT_184269 [Helobdella robusta]XP_009031118.1 hypothetical protein HELRODRAFT_182625 [Helobdella robusta]ESN90794.1 hypothetical protein HELRODRAFT_182625 [Helobdella robusta]ESO03831.1 hypothetical protein HELRODRAFT_184269 [Helobdella robusta]
MTALDELNTTILRKELRQRNLDSKGTKAVFIDRIRDALINENKRVTYMQPELLRVTKTVEANNSNSNNDLETSLLAKITTLLDTVQNKIENKLSDSENMHTST